MALLKFDSKTTTRKTIFGLPLRACQRHLRLVTKKAISLFAPVIPTLTDTMFSLAVSKLATAKVAYGGHTVKARRAPKARRAVHVTPKARLYDNILETIGNTPIVKINRLAPEGVTMYAKAEFFNPCSSVKDRYVC